MIVKCEKYSLVKFANFLLLRTKKPSPSPLISANSKYGGLVHVFYKCMQIILISTLSNCAKSFRTFCFGQKLAYVMGIVNL